MIRPSFFGWNRGIIESDEIFEEGCGADIVDV